MYSRFLLFISILLLISTAGCKDTSTNSELPEAQFPCENGLAAGVYNCENVDLYARISAEELGGARVNDIWGWTDPVTGNEYALVGLYDGVSFVNISDPNNPVVVGKLAEPNATAKIVTDKSGEFPACNFGIGTSKIAQNLPAKGSVWRDHKVYKDHLFVVSDGQIHGMQVFNLGRLRNNIDASLNETFEQDAFYDLLGNAHNIAINEETGFAYATGVTSASVCGARDGTGLHMIDISSPLNPEFAGCYIDKNTDRASYPNIAPGYIHDTQCVVYNGNDIEYAGKEVCFSSAEGAVVITDVTDKSNPETIGLSGQSEMQYSHQGWLTEDHQFFLMNDELDENNLGRNTKTYIWDVSDLDNPLFVGHYTHTTPTIDHNLYIKDNYIFQSNYTAGLRVFELGDLSNAELNPAGYFDTQPNNNNVEFSGTWSNYPFFESGVVIVSDINDGLFILKPNF